jgi:hypothetical protein
MVRITSIPSTAPEGPNRVVQQKSARATELTYQDSELSAKCDGQQSPDSCISDPPTAWEATYTVVYWASERD